MKKFLIIFAFCVLAALTYGFSNKEETVTYSGNIQNVMQEKTQINVGVVQELPKLDPVEKALIDMENELDEIESISDIKEWYIEYREILGKYSYILPYPLSIFDYYTEDEIFLMCRVIETECYDQDFISKCNVASVILNRIENGNFGDDVKDVITKENQFAYYRMSISEDTILALMYAFEIEDTTHGCIAFRSDKNPETWYCWNYTFTDPAGHHFYKE